jgi:hypothetical protein
MKTFCKWYLWILIINVIITVSPMTSFGAGSCAVTSVNLDNVTRVTWVCTGDSSNGGFPANVTASPTLRGWVYVVDTTPGTTTPTASSGFTLLSSESNADIMGGSASTMLGATAGRAVPSSSGWINGTLTPVITGNSVASAVFTIRAWVWNQVR